MKNKLRCLLGFRSSTPWKQILAIVYYVACAAFLVIGMTTPPLVSCGLRDAVVVKLSTFVLFLWMFSPAFFLSDTPFRKRLPFFKKQIAMYSIAGMMVVFILFQYLFMAVESLHSHAYLDDFRAYISVTNDEFMKAGGLEE